MSLSERIQSEARPRDPVFERWERESKGAIVGDDDFRWLPSHGMGRLPTSDPPYDVAYFENYRRLAGTAMGRAITAARVDLVNGYTDGHVVDVGIGCGAFVEARLGWTWGYDINPEGVRWLESRGRWRDPYKKPVHAVTLWDVLEHLTEPHILLAQVSQFVFASLPIVPSELGPPQGWRHYKPREHCWYWTHTGFVEWMREHGFECRASSTIETKLGRLDIGTFAFERGSRS